MQQDRKRNQDMPNRSSNMEQAEGSRENVSESIRNRKEDDLGTSSDRAMFEERESAEERDSHSGTSSSERPGTTRERGRSNAGGITNRPLDEEMDEQGQLPDRGNSQSDSER